MKKIIALMLILLLVISAAACSQKEVEITPEDESQISEAANDAKLGISKLNPIGKSATASFKDKDGIEENVTITVDEVIRGEKAWAFIDGKAKQKGGLGKDKKPKDETQEYLIAKITFTLNSFDESDQKKPSTFYATSENGERYPNLSAPMLYNNVDFADISLQTIEVGKTVTAYKVFQVKKSDTTPLLAYRNLFQDNSDGMWFALY